MCGIAGIIDFNNNPVNREDIERMLNCVSYRGPDNTGYYFQNNIAFGHNRLSVIDLSKEANQPMHYKGYVIVYNGEIYNYVEVREELLKSGYSFTTNSDTEVIMAAYDYWGDDCVSRFNGMWAFAIYNKLKNTVFCSRDRFGVKPFYYTIHNNRLLFASEIKQLIQPGMRRNVCVQVLADYIVLGLEDYNDKTFFEGIIKLLPSHNIAIDINTGKTTTNRYYTLKYDSSIAGIPVEECISLYYNEFLRSVKMRLRSDVKVGTCLSGGLDSSSVAAIAAGLYKSNGKENFSAVTAKSTEKRSDETRYAEMVAMKYSLDWHVTSPGMNEFSSSLNDIIYSQDEPFGSPSIVMQHYVMKSAKKAGITVLLDGQGGDETLLGYERYFPAVLKNTPFTGKINQFLLSSKHSKLTIKQLFQYYLYFTKPGLRLKRQLNRVDFLKKEIRDLINRDIIKKISGSYKNIKELQIIEITSTQLPHLLKYEDRNSMWFSIETRLPFLDYKLVELAVSLNDSYKVNNGWTKYILRKSMENHLPDEIIWRKNKIGFEAPVNSWLSNKSEIMNVINKSQIIRKISDREFKNSEDNNLLWKLFNIALWEKIFNVGIS